MSVDKTERALLAQEVVALGEELFELALRGHGVPADVGSEPDEEAGAAEEELQAAAGAFFRVLRRLLVVEEE